MEYYPKEIMERSEKIRIGDMLIQQKFISEDQLNNALNQQKHTRLKLGRILVNSGFVSEKIISETLAMQLDIKFIDIEKFLIKPEVVRLIPECEARRLQTIVLEDKKGTYLVGMTDPTDEKSVLEVSRILQHQIEVGVVTEGQLLEGIDRGYWRTREING